MPQLSELYFGDLEALDEGRLHEKYFLDTFVIPSSFSVRSLNNRGKFIIVGRKGSGKTAAQFWLAESIRKEGYLSSFFSFYTDLRPDDHIQLSRTQSIDFIEVANKRNIFLHYDFRDIWERTFFLKIAEGLASSGIRNEFTDFCTRKRSRLSNLFDGILKSLSIEISGELSGICAKVGIDLAAFKDGIVPLRTYNAICRELVKDHFSDTKYYLFVDELVFSKLDAHDDEVKVRAAMVRDIVRTARELNIFFALNGFDVHIICSLRPEIRNLLNELDSEIGKIVDGRDVSLDWNFDSGQDSLLWRIFENKVRFSHSPCIEFERFVCKSISFSGNSRPLIEFLKTNTWNRPRDIVRLLISIAKINPNSDSIREEDLRRSLDEYSRSSIKEIIDELSVRYGPLIFSRLRQAIDRREYESGDVFKELMNRTFPELDSEAFFEELFIYGVIDGVDRRNKRTRFYDFHRGEEYMKNSYRVQIHPGLWNYFNVR